MHLPTRQDAQNLSLARAEVARCELRLWFMEWMLHSDWGYELEDVDYAKRLATEWLNWRAVVEELER